MSCGLITPCKIFLNDTFTQEKRKKNKLDSNDLNVRSHCDAEEFPLAVWNIEVHMEFNDGYFQSVS